MSRVYFGLFCMTLTCGFAAGQTPSSLALSSSANPSTYGQAVTLTAAVTPSATGKVTFYQDATVLGTSNVTAGQATLTTVLLSAGASTLHAHYLGDSTYAPSNSGVISQTILSQPSLAFQPQVNYFVAPSLGQTAIGDFNADGRQDLVVLTGVGTTSGYVLLGNGDGSFQTPVSFGDMPSRSVAVGDFNGDGKSDLVVTTSSQISVLLGNGNGTFGSSVSYTLAATATNVAVADFNNDGVPDVGAGTSSGVTVLFGKGDGTFLPPVSLSLVYGGFLAIGDLNGDGNADLAVAGAYSALEVLFGNGDGTFGSPISVVSGYGFTALVISDVNGDGKPDLAGPLSDNEVGLILGNGDGTFQPMNATSGLQFDYEIPLSLTTGDINGDGKADLIPWGTIYRAGSLFASVAVLLGNGDGTFQPVTYYYVGIEVATGVVVGDFNGDGKADLATSTAPTEANPSYIGVILGGEIPLSISVAPSVSLSQGQPGATYTIRVSNVGQLSIMGNINVTDVLPAGLTATSIAGTGWTCTLASLTCTRSDSLTAGTTFPSITLTVDIPANVFGETVNTATLLYVSNLDLGKTTATTTVYIRPVTHITLTSSPNPSTLGRPLTLTASIDPAATGQVTFYDGINLLGMATITSGQAVFVTDLLPSGLRNLRCEYSGDTNYAPAASPVHIQTINALSDDGAVSSASIQVGPSPVYLATGDFNRDGIPDLVSANQGSVPASSGSLSVLLGNGDGTFRAAVAYPLPGGPFNFASAIAVGDFNRDGLPDLAATGAGINILLGNGDGTFRTPVNFGNSTIGFNGLSAADVNQDGILDVIGIISNSSNSNGITVFFGNGDGTFQLGISTPIAISTWAFLDLNADGIPDVLGATGAYGAPVLAYLGKTDGTFQAALSSPGPANQYATSIAAGDFNGDGKPDAAVVYWNAIAFLAGNGDGTFQPPVTSSLNVTPGNPVIAADFDGDGKIDIGVPAYSGSGFTIAFGNGNGTFQAGLTYPTHGQPINALVADFNLSGKPDFAVLNQNTNTVDIYLGGEAAIPQPVSVTQDGYSGSTQDFIFTFSDTNGYADLAVTDILINNYLDGIGACYIGFVPNGPSAGYVYLVDDAGDGGYVSGTPMLLPSSGTLHNSQCTINGAASSVSANGNTLTLTLAITFASGFAGNKILYTAARSNTQNSGWEALGTWGVPGPVIIGPAVGGMTPGRSTTTGETFGFTFTDTNGYSDLGVLDILTNSFLDGINACYIAYVPTSASTGYLYLVDDAGDGGYTSGSPILLSSGGTLQNSQCTISTAGSSASALGDYLNLNLAITFSPSFAGNQVFYLAARNNGTGNSGWQAVGSVTVPN